MHNGAIKLKEGCNILGYVGVIWFAFLALYDYSIDWFYVFKVVLHNLANNLGWNMEKIWIEN